MAIEKVEAVYKKLETISQIWAYGNSLENVLVAVVVLDETALPWAKKNGLPGDLKVSNSAIYPPPTARYPCDDETAKPCAE